MPDDKTSMYHEHHRALQDDFDGRGLADALEAKYKLDAFGPDEKSFIEEAEFFFLATAYGDSVDCSFKGGPKSFVEVTGPNSLKWTDLDGNSMYRSLGNIQGSKRAGLLFIRFGPSPQRLRVNGTCTFEKVSHGGSARLTVHLIASEIFPNCPRYIPDLENQKPSPYNTVEDAVGPKPNWKDHEELAPYLPEDDPHR